METHREAVAAIAARVASFYEQKIPFRLYHGSTNTTRQRKVDPNKVIDTSRLSHVLAVDTVAKTCLVEPNVAMDELVDATLPYGLLPPVVMEFPGITVGGGFAGTAGESSGFKYGFFDCIVNWIEIVLADGEVVRASPTERADLFHGAAGSFGTLGVTTLLELRLIPARKFVELTYHPVHGVPDALATMDRVTAPEAGNDYVDGILYSLGRGVIVTGRLTDQPSAGVPIQRFYRAQDPWFYIHVDRRTRAGCEVREATPVRDYLFRYDRGAFWTGKYAFQYFLTPFNRITRWALDWFLRTRVMYHALHASGHADKYIVQDLLLPRASVDSFVRYVGERFSFWPLWLCPLRRGQDVSLHPRLGDDVYGKDDDKSVSFVNIGVWGPGSTSFPRFVEQNRSLETKLRELGGIKWLYAQAFYTEDEFWSIYDREWYDGLRQKYHATTLPNVYQKVRVDLSKNAAQTDGSWSGWLRNAAWGIWPVSGVYGVVKTLMERDYLLAK